MSFRKLLIPRGWVWFGLLMVVPFWMFAIVSSFINPVVIKRMAVVETVESRLGIAIEVDRPAKPCVLAIKGVRIYWRCGLVYKTNLIEMDEMVNDPGFYLARVEGKWMMPYDIHKDNKYDFDVVPDKRLVYGRIVDATTDEGIAGWVVWRKTNAATVLPTNSSGAFSGLVDVGDAYEIGAVSENGIGVLEINDQLSWEKELIIYVNKR